MHVHSWWDLSPATRPNTASAPTPTWAEAQFALGYVNWLLDWDWPAAEARVRRAIALDPSNAAEHRVLGHILSQTGRHREAEALMRRCRELDPLEPLNHALPRRSLSRHVASTKPS